MQYPFFLLLGLFSACRVVSSIFA